MCAARGKFSQLSRDSRGKIVKILNNLGVKSVEPFIFQAYSCTVTSYRYVAEPPPLVVVLATVDTVKAETF